MHPLPGRLVAVRSFKRLNGELLLVIELPDGSPGTIPADATDVLGLPRRAARRWCWMREGGAACGNWWRRWPGGTGRAGDGAPGRGCGVWWLRAAPAR